ncbi:acetyltransferase 3 super family [Candidatus Termititenax persephonae]|uniref:Acetyltransferase 3 super family n=1 Tax=Candidatus Termititenax persephonae TaxID=2218525 RepID=A0A388TGW5_9BACT|nr:acetyltransferase 3 super family [Candidatus Termititenax persephonae]
MFNTEIITEKAHFAWLETLKDDATKLYFLAYLDDVPAAVVDFTSIDYQNKTCEWGFYLFENAQLIGALLEHLLLNYVFAVLKIDLLYCRVLAENVSVYRLHTKRFPFVQNSCYNFLCKDRLFNGLSLTKTLWQERRVAMEQMLRLVFDFSAVVWER